MDASSMPSDEAVRPSLKRLGGAFVGLLQGHLELLGLEFQEEKEHALRLFLFAGLSLVFGLLTLLGVSAAVLIAFWDTHRLTAVLGLCLVYGLALLLCGVRTLRLARRDTSPFQASLEELARNRELLP